MGKCAVFDREVESVAANVEDFVAFFEETFAEANGEVVGEGLADFEGVEALEEGAVEKGYGEGRGFSDELVGDYGVEVGDCAVFEFYVDFSNAF